MTFPPPRPFARASARTLGRAAALVLACVATAANARSETLTLADATTRALRENPEFRVLELERDAALARRDQAGARSNPELSIDLENFGGDLPGFSSSETTVSLGRLFELGGKRDARVESARSALLGLAVDLEASRRAIAAETARRYYGVLAAETSLALFEDAARLAEEVKTAVASKVRVGAVPRTEETRAELELESARLREREAADEATLSRLRLSSLWGESSFPFDALAESLGTVEQAPSLDTLRERLDRSPQIARMRAAIEERRAHLALAKSSRVPDLTIRTGARRLAGEDAVTFTGSVSTSLPLFDRGRARVAEASAMIAHAEAALERTRVDLTLRLAENHALIERSRRRVETLRTRILPAAERAFQETREGYALGRFEYIDLLEARRALASSRREEIDALLDHHVAVADAELLLGGPLNEREPTGQEAP